jgi:murein hydrolase activator
MTPLFSKTVPILLLLSFLPALPPGGPDQARAARAATAVESMESKRLEQLENAERLGWSIEEQKSSLADSMRKEAELLVQLESLENQLKADHNRLLELWGQIEKQETLLAEKQLARDNLLLELQELDQQVRRRLAAFYRLGEVGIFNMLFSASSLPELLEVEEYFKRLLQHDRRMIISFRQKITEANEAGEKLSEENLRLTVLQAVIEKQEQRTAATRREQMALLQSVQIEKKLHESALRELDMAVSQLAVIQEKLREETPVSPPGWRNMQRRENPVEEQGFAVRKGSLPPPVAGLVVTGFGDEISGNSGMTRTTGIGIKTEPGAPIRAIYKGRVLYAGYLQGYGNLLIIDHGRQYYSLVSPAAKFLAEEDAEVQIGHVVGIMGGHSDPAAGVLQFEIRHGSEPQDPLSWLDTSSLSFPATGEREKIRPDFSSFQR